MLFACGFSITLGYHRLFFAFSFSGLIGWFACLPSSLEPAHSRASVLWWASEHRDHHKHVDHDEDPYSISKGLFHAHIGWLMFKPETGNKLRERG